MMKNIKEKLKKLLYFYRLFDRDIPTLCRFIKLNFLSPNVRRYGQVFFYPYKNVSLSLDPSAVIELYGDFHIGSAYIKGHGQYSRLIMGKYARITVNKSLTLLEGCDVQILQNGTMTVDDFHSNVGLEVLCGNQIRLIGEVTAGRHVRLKDYNGHEVSFNGYPYKRAIIIEDHVWLCTGSTINPGCYIESGVVIGDNSNVISNIPAETFVQGNPACIIANNIKFKI